MGNPNKEWRDADPININVTDENKSTLSSQSFAIKIRTKRRREVSRLTQSPDSATQTKLLRTTATAKLFT